MKTGQNIRHAIITSAMALGATVFPFGFSSAGAAEITKKPAASAPAAVPTPPPPPPAPLGVFGVDMPAPGKLILSITPVFANLSGIKMGTRTVWNEYIVSTVPFFLNPRQTVRIVPQNIALATQILGLNYGVTKDFAVVFTAGMVERNLEALTFKGTSGIIPLGWSYPSTAGLADFTLSGVYRIYQDEIHRIQINVGLAFPTGVNNATFSDFLLPNGLRSNIRAFYGMQPGAGTFDAMPGIVYAGNLGPWSWGLSYRARLPLAANRQGYRWGDLHEFNGWAGYTWTPGLTTTFRASGVAQGPIRGLDPEIRGAAVPANPLFYGGQRIELFGGAVISGKFIGFENTTLAVEAGLPVYQNLNGPQIMKNWQAGMSLRFKI
ncbi:alpha-amylase [Methylocystis sp. IM3]|uniref:alpha-amylase n=1 Tax=unclassified Methylocystis TaxID=2625913 RepID=UPI0031194E58